MSYADGEALLLAQLRQVTGFSSNNTSRGNWLILNRDKGDKYCVIRPEASIAREFGEGSVNNRWVCTIEVWQKYTDDGTTMTNLQATVAAIQARLDLYPHMQDGTNTVADAYNSAVGPILRVPGTGGPHWLLQELTFQWFEQVALTYQE